MLTEKKQERDNESIQPGVSILVREAQDSKHYPKRPGGSLLSSAGSEESSPGGANWSFRLKSLRTLLLYLLLFVSTAAILMLLDGMPHLPERVWSWQDIWDKLSGPSAGVPLDFIKYLTCSLGWFMLTYVAFTLFVEALVDLFFLFSISLGGGGQPGRVARGLKRVTGLLPLSPGRRALDGLLLGAAFFAVVTTVASGRGAVTTDDGLTHPGGDREGSTSAPEAAGLVLETPDSYQADYNFNNAQRVQTDVALASFHPHYSSVNPNLERKDADNASGNFQTLLLTGSNTKTQSDASLSTQKSDIVEVTHRVKPGDTLWSLAERYYGDGQFYSKIYEANLGQAVGGGSHFDAGGIIQEGWILNVPGVTNTHIASVSDTAATTMTEAGQSQGQEQKQEVYVVQSGDSMRAIAQKFLGNEMRWPEIWKLNVGQTMPDGRVPANPDLIFAGWQLKLPVSEAVQPPLQPPATVQPPSTPPQQPSGSVQPPPSQSVTPPPAGKGNNGNSESPQQPVQNPTPVVEPTQPPVSVNPGHPGQTPAFTPAPTITPQPQVRSQPSMPQPATVQPQQPDRLQEQPQHSAQEGFWPVLEGLGGLLTLSGLGLGLYRVGGVLRRRRTQGKLNQPRRSRWQAYREINEWESDNTPQTRAHPLVRLNQWGDEKGFASTRRPLELLKLRLQGFDADRPRLVLQALQSVFVEEGLPPLQPVSCIDLGQQLTYFFKGTPQNLAAYLSPAGAGKEELENSTLFSSASTASEDETFKEHEEDWQPDNNDDDDNDEGQKEEENNSSDTNKGKVISFLFGKGRKQEDKDKDKDKDKDNEEETETFQPDNEEILQAELVEAIIGKLGGRVWIEKQREGLVVRLEGVEARYCYSPVAMVNQVSYQEDEEEAGTDRNKVVEYIADLELPGPVTLYPQGERETGESENESDVYQAYIESSDESIDDGDAGTEAEIEVGLAGGTRTRSVTTSGIQIRSIDRLRQEFAHISRENEGGQSNLDAVEEEEGNNGEDSFPTISEYLLFDLGAWKDEGFDFDKTQTPQTEDIEAGLSAASYGHLGLCLEECGNLLLVAGKGDEAAQSILQNCIFQMATSTGGGPDELALYLIDRPVALNQEEIQSIGGDFGLSSEVGAGRMLADELQHNREVWNLLTVLPQTVVVVEGGRTGSTADNNNQKTGWLPNTVELIDALLEELVRRRAANAGISEIGLESETDKSGNDGEAEEAEEAEEEAEQSENGLPRLVLVVSDLAAIAATEAGNGLIQLLSEGPQWGLYVLGTTSYEALVQGQTYHNNYHPNSGEGLLVLQGLAEQFGSLGLFVAPDERSSEQLLGGSQAAFELSGEGDMLLRPINRQLFRLRGFRAEIEEVRKGVELLGKIYNPILKQAQETTAIEELGQEQPLARAGASEDGVTNSDVVQEVRLNNLETVREAAEQQPQRNNLRSHEGQVVNLPSSPLTELDVREGKREGEEEKVGDFSVSLEAWRWKLLQGGLLQPAITIHVLHGLSIHFALLPTAQKNRVGKGYHFPVSPDSLAAYKLLKEAGLNYQTLAKAISKEDITNLAGYINPEKLQPVQTEQLLDRILELRSNKGKEELNDRVLLQELLAQGFDHEEVENASVALQELFHHFVWLESDNLMPLLQNGDLALLSYLALHQGAQSRYTVGQAVLKPTETDKQLLRNLEVRLNRTHKNLRDWVKTGLQEIFGNTDEAGTALEGLIKNDNGLPLNFIKEDTRRETLRLNDQLVWVDLTEFERLLTGYRQPVSNLNRWEANIKPLQEAYWLVQSTVENYTDEVAESRLKLLGVWGDRYATDWEDLTILRQHIIQRWFDLNMALGDYYAKPLTNNGQEGPEREQKIGLAVEHYSQAALVQPTYPEPVKALISLYHSKNDLAGLRVVFRDYCACCRRDDQEPEEDIVELYHKAVGSKNRRISNRLSEERRIV